MQKNHRDEKHCPIHEASKLLGDTWSILIIRQLLSGPKRFGDLELSIDTITSSTLSERLKKLQAAKLLTRKQYDCIPPKVEYKLTRLGKNLEGLIEEIESFAKKFERAQKK